MGEMETKDSSQDNGWRKGFWSLFVVQFQGAFSDNVFKFLVVFLVSASVADEVRDRFIPLILALFSLPFLIFSMAAGYLADRYPKPNVIIGTKLLEILIMIAGTVGLYLQNTVILTVVLFFMGVQSAFFSPSKYGLLPEILPEERLSWGNGFLGLGTFMAIITGGVLAGILSDRLGYTHAWMAGAFLIVLAVGGWLISKLIPPLPAANPTKKFRLNFITELWANIQIIRQDRILKLALVGSVYFWFLAALFGEPTVLVYGEDLLGLDGTKISILRAFLAIGIAIGCAGAGYLSAGHIEYALVPIGIFGMAAAAAFLGLPGLTFYTVGGALFVLGFFGGFYDIPINALLQHRPDAKDKGSVMATNGWLTSAGVFTAAGIFWVLKSAMGLEPTTIFLVGAVVTAMVGVYAMTVVGEAFPAFFRRIFGRSSANESK
jgi:acyl-[acyl-carrier-protein]-phospholipid O-acyltransferase / long-chain-fatty-acid--[acyl-carrier-protein] ligase